MKFGIGGGQNGDGRGDGGDDFDPKHGLGPGAASASVREQRRLLDEMADADRSVWAWFPPIFVIAFTLLSFAGTYIGLRDIIATGDLRYGAFGDTLVLVLVLLATGAMVFFLRRAVLNFFSLGGVASFGAYLLLLFFSVTFGFAFYWGRLEASGQAISGATSSLEQLSDQIQTSAFALRSTAGDLSALSDEFQQLAVQERLQGGTCGDGSGGGYGPRTRHRERRAQEIEARVARIAPRFAVVQGPIATLEAELKKIEALSKPGGGFDALDDFGLTAGSDAGAATTPAPATPAPVTPAPSAPQNSAAPASGGGSAPRADQFDYEALADGASPQTGAAPVVRAPVPAAAPTATNTGPAYDAETLANNPAAAREAQFRETRLAARRAAVEINALAGDATLASLAAEFRQWGAEYQDPGLVRRDDPQGSSYQCIQFAAGQRLEAAADRLENLPRVSAPDLPDYAGADATREAVFRMLDTVGGAFSGGSALDALFSQEASSLTPQGEAALRSSVGAAVQDARLQSGASGPVLTAQAKGLRSEDRFPLAVAIIIDLLLFAFVLIEKPGRKYFDRMKRRVNEAVREEFDPLRMVALRQALEQDEDWRLLRQYRFDYDDRTFLVVPVTKKLPPSPEQREQELAEGKTLEELEFVPEPMSPVEQLKTEALRDVVMLWKRNRILRRAYFKPEELKKHLQRSGRFDYAEWEALDCYEFMPDGFEQLLLSGMTAGKRLERREERAQKQIWGMRRRAADRELEAPAQEMLDDDPQVGSPRDDASWRETPEKSGEETVEPRRASLRARMLDYRQRRRAAAEQRAAQAEQDSIRDEAHREPQRDEPYLLDASQEAPAYREQDPDFDPREGDGAPYEAPINLDKPHMADERRAAEMDRLTADQRGSNYRGGSSRTPERPRRDKNGLPLVTPRREG